MLFKLYVHVLRGNVCIAFWTIGWCYIEMNFWLIILYMTINFNSKGCWRWYVTMLIAKLLQFVTHSLTHSLTHGAEPFLTSCQLCSYSRTSQHFMEPGGSSPRSHKPSPVPILSQIDPIQFVHTLIYYETHKVSDTWCFRLQMKVWEVPVSYLIMSVLICIYRCSFTDLGVQWLRSALSNGSSIAGDSRPFAWEREENQFPKRCDF
jgi:hypothetical protein